MTIEALRTDNTRFGDLPDWPYRPKYLETMPGFEDLRMHYVTKGLPTHRSICVFMVSRRGHIYIAG